MQNRTSNVQITRQKSVDVSVADVVLYEFYFSDLKQTKKRPVLVIIVQANKR
jgi:hypothetical protein